MDSAYSGKGPVESSFEHGKELSCSTKCREYLE
jgi:hypothetical protein